MKLTEVIISITIFLISVTVFFSCLINIRRNINTSSQSSNSALVVLSIDHSIRNEISKVNITYWKNFENEFSSIAETVRTRCTEKGIEVLNVTPIYDKLNKSEGINVTWSYNGTNYDTKEFIKQRIFDE